MIVLELAFDAHPARLAARAAHRRRLAALHANGVLVMAGPWADDSGALLVFAAERSEVDRFLAEDPYYTTEGVRVVDLREWRPVVP
ncbi:YciI family protein [Actinophytocola sp.]|uniref:YciI family protein n=1 Tax=Actinophytocola sp. TaxID=1872138 RepID=UPI003899A682